MITRLFLLALICATSTFFVRADGLTTRAGRVTGEQKKPIAGATIRTIGATPLIGEDEHAPVAFAGVGKAYTTDADGTYELVDLDPDLHYTVAITAPGYKPKIIEELKAKEPKDISTNLKPAPADSGPGVAGHIVDIDGHPLAGVLVELTDEIDDNQNVYDRPKDVDRYAVTGDDGAFQAAAPGDKKRVFFARVSAWGYAPQVQTISSRPDAPDANDVKLSRGCTVTGRLVKDGQPMAGVKMMLAQAERMPDRMIGYFNIGTDAAGKFTFENVPENDDYLVIAAMTSLAARGATLPVPLKTELVAGSTTDIGDVVVGPAVTISGTFTLNGPTPAPFRGLTVWATPLKSFEEVHANVTGDGSFKLKGLPPGLAVSIQLSSDKVKLATDNKNYLPNSDSLLGKLEKDVALHLKLDAGASGGSTNGYTKQEWDALLETPYE